MSRILVSPLTQALMDREAVARMPSVNVLSCGGCGTDKWRMFEDGTVACSNCNELGAGVVVSYGGFVPCDVGRYPLVGSTNR